MGSILGSHQSSTQSQQSSGQGTSQSMQGSSSTNNAQSTSSSFSGPGMSAQDVLSQWQGGKQSTDQWSKSAALDDVKGVLKAQAMDALQQVMPSIGKVDRGSGAYNSTTTELLTNDAGARITAQLAKTGLDAITQYGQLSNTANQNNNQLLSSLSGTAKDTGTSGSSSQSTQTGKSDSFGLSQSQYEQDSSGGGKSSGGSGLFGLFSGWADGGEVPTQDAGNGAMKMFMDMSGMSRELMDMQDMTAAAKKMLDGQWKEGAQAFAKTSAISEEDKNSLKMINSFMDAYKGGKANGGKVGGGYADGGLVAEKLLHRENGGNVPGFGQQMQAPPMPTFVFNIGTGAPPKVEEDPVPFGASAAQNITKMGEGMMGGEGGPSEMTSAPTTGGAAEGAASSAAEGAASSAAESAAEESLLSVMMADGGVVPEGFTKLFAKEDGSGDADGDDDSAIPRNTLTPTQQLMQAIKRYNNGGSVRTAETDVRKGGKIQGPQSPSGEDNQVIAVAGGEGVIPKDVMEVKGVPELLRHLIQTYHTPVNGGK